MDDSIIPPKSQFCRKIQYRQQQCYMDVGDQNIVVHSQGLFLEVIPFKQIGVFIETNEHLSIIINISKLELSLKFENDDDKKDTIQFITQVVNNPLRLLDIMIFFEGNDVNKLNKFKQINLAIIDKRINEFE